MSTALPTSGAVRKVTRCHGVTHFYLWPGSQDPHTAPIMSWGEWGLRPYLLPSRPESSPGAVAGGLPRSLCVPLPATAVGRPTCGPPPSLPASQETRAGTRCEVSLPNSCLTWAWAPSFLPGAPAPPHMKTTSSLPPAPASSTSPVLVPLSLLTAPGLQQPPPGTSQVHAASSLAVAPPVHRGPRPRGRPGGPFTGASSQPPCG